MDQSKNDQSNRMDNNNWSKKLSKMIAQKVLIKTDLLKNDKQKHFFKHDL